MQDRPVIGWRERVAFPRWGITGIEAKIDTGARTSAIHVENIRKVREGRVRFEVVLSRRKPEKRVLVEADVVRLSRVRSSTGHRQTRYVVAATMKIGGHRRKIELSLVCRQHMICRMLLGRTALGDFLIDPQRKHLHNSQAGQRPRRSAK